MFEWCDHREPLAVEILTELTDGVLVLGPHKVVGEQLACEKTIKLQKNNSVSPSIPELGWATQFDFELIG